MQSSAKTWVLLVLACACAPLLAQQAEDQADQRDAQAVQDAQAQGANENSTTQGPPTKAGLETDDEWLDRFQNGVHDVASNSAMRLDRLFGSDHDAADYQGASGSLAPSLLWDEFDGFQPKLRFRVTLPLPQINERFNAFIGKVDRDEYVSERAQESGAIPRQYGPANDEQTLAGIVYRTPSKQGSRFDAGAGVRVRFPLDPYIKGAYVYERGKSESGLLSLRETVFWQNSQHAGFTTRVDLERLVAGWLVRWTTSGTISEESDGVFGYSSVMALMGLPNRRAVAVEVGFDGEADAPVPLHEYGVKVGYRQSVIRDWLVLEVRSSLTYPKEEPEQHRAPSWGVGVGFEMFFGANEFLARPVTF
ncbi:MAG: hypothetical protein ABI885_03055 [Gammaproteobacteria bacterium]